MTKSTIIELLEGLLEKQNKHIENNPEPKVENLYRHGVKDAFEYALLLIKDMD